MKVSSSAATVAAIFGIAILSHSGCHGYTPSTERAVSTSRRTFFQRSSESCVAIVSAAAFVGVTTGAVPPAEAAASDVGTCPTRSNNCIRTTWTPPAGTSATQASQTIKAVLDSYPQEGQAGVDLSGWTLVEDHFGDVGSVSRIEFRSGIGNFAKFLNGGKPFVDDVWVQVDPTTSSVQIRSSSRVGDSDLGVNQKRLQYFTKALSSKGWDVPEPTY